MAKTMPIFTAARAISPRCLTTPIGLKNWGQITCGIITTIGGVGTTVLGAAVVGIGVVEAGSVAGAVFSPHTIGAGGVVVGAGVTTSFFGIKMIMEELRDSDDWIDGIMQIDLSPDQIKSCPAA